MIISEKLNANQTTQRITTFLQKTLQQLLIFADISPAHGTKKSLYESTHFQKTITRLSKPTIFYRHISKYEKVALKDLSKRDSIIITNANRGSAVVIMDVNDYIREAKRWPNNSKNYNVFAKEFTTTNNDHVNQTFDRFIKE